MPYKKIILFLLLSISGFSQDLYSKENAKKFADFLFKSGQFELATKEYERLVFMSPEVDSLKLQLIKSYRLASNLSLAEQKVKIYYPDTQKIPYPIAIEYSKILMSMHQWENSNKFCDANQNLKTDDKVLLKTTSFIFDSNLKKAKIELENIENKQNYLAVEYNSILNTQLKYKKPALAGIFSAIIPGAGKAYSKNWKDGLVSFIFTMGMCYQSYRNFNKHGFQNYRGWVYVGIGFGFYLGNIYGSVKSAKQFNQKQIDKIQHEASNLFNTVY